MNLENLSAEIVTSEVAHKIIKEYIDVFDQLFSDGLKENSIQAQINELVANNALSEAQQLNYDYLTRLCKLKNIIDKLPDDFSFKDRILNRLLDNCSSEWLDKVENGTFTNSEKDFNAFMQREETFDWSNTVEIRSWGTEEELGNGLKNVLRKQVKKDDVGHVSLTMRLPVNENNQKLIEQYCIDEHGNNKIPYQIKYHGNKPFYEIYWSFWPGCLHTLSEDITSERKGFEFTLPSKTYGSLPPEIKERYTITKQRKDFFGKNHLIDLAPTAVRNINSKEQDSARNEFLKLKMNKYQMEDELSSIGVLWLNYFDNTKIFDTSTQWESKTIESSNFLILIDRFKDQLSEKTICNKVLNEKTISKKEAEQLFNDIKILYKQKTDAIDKIKEEIKTEAQKIYPPSAEIKALKIQKKACLKEMKTNTDAFDYYIAALVNLMMQDNPQNNNNVKEICDALSSETDKTQLDEIASSTTLSKEQIQFLLDELQREKNIDIQNIKKQLTQINDQLEAISRNPKGKTLEILEKRKQDNEQNLQYFENKLNDFLSNPTFNAWDDPEISKEIENLQEAKIECNKEYEPIHDYCNFFIQLLEESSNQDTLKVDEDIQELCKWLSNENNKTQMDEISSVIELSSEQIRLLLHAVKSVKNSADEEQQQKLTQIQDKLDTIRHNFQLSLENIINTTQESIKSLSESITSLELSSNVSSSTLVSKNIIRGMPTKNVVLKEFKVEDMLKKASELADQTRAFHLYTQNCSTTSMEILNAGAPDEYKQMFKPAEKNKDGIISNTVLYNPQAVHSATTLVRDAQNGDKNAEHLVKVKMKVKPNTGYNVLMNKLMSSSENINVLLKKMTTNFFNLLTAIPYLINDLLVKENKGDEKSQKSALDKYFNQLNSAVKSQGYEIIQNKNPELAIDTMKEKLQSSPHALPFFDKNTLNLVRSHILKLEADDPDNPKINHYKKIITERDERLSCIENAVVQHLNPRDQLIARKDNSQALERTLNPPDQIEKIVNQFTQAYTQLKNQEFGSRLTISNVLKSLGKLDSNEQKLHAILDHIKDNPNSRSAKAWKELSINPAQLVKLGFKPPPTPSTHSNNFKNRMQTIKQEQKQQEMVEENVLTSSISNPDL